jgi:hypothetical protein
MSKSSLDHATPGFAIQGLVAKNKRSCSLQLPISTKRAKTGKISGSQPAELIYVQQGESLLLSWNQMANKLDRLGVLYRKCNSVAKPVVKAGL